MLGRAWIAVGLALVSLGCAERWPETTQRVAEVEHPRPADTLGIHDVQGAAHVSVLVGEEVRVEGVVTLVEAEGFYFQTLVPDADDRTSQALFARSRSALGVSVGDRVVVTGVVEEHRARCELCAANESALSQTELDVSGVRRLGNAASLPVEVVLGPDGIRARDVIEDDALGDVEAPAVRFDPGSDALDLYESLEGMRVLVQSPRVVGPSRTGSEFSIVPQGAGGAETARGGLLAAPNRNPARLCVRTPMAVELDVGARFDDDVIGVFSGHGPCLVVSELPALETASEKSELGWDPPRLGELSIASLNAHNLSLDVEPEALHALASLIARDLRAPDVVLLSEIQDDSGARDDGVVSAELTLRALTAALSDAGAAGYHWLQVDPTDGEDGGQPGANIRQVFLYREARGLTVATPDLAAAGQGAALGAFGALTDNPSRVEPTHPAFIASRKPLAAAFDFGKARLLMLGNHFVSKLGDDPDFGRFQPPARPSSARRKAQAEVVGAWVNDVIRNVPDARVIVLGDLNDSHESDALSPLRAAGLVPLTELIALDERYSYVYEGNSEALDHVFVDEITLDHVSAVSVLHVHADFAQAGSDHDPVIVRLSWE